MLGSLWLDLGDCAVGVAVSWAGPEKGAGAIRGLETDPEGPRVADFPVKKLHMVPTFVSRGKYKNTGTETLSISLSLYMYKNTMHTVYPIYCMR